MRNLVFGSYSARGKKKRRNIRRLTPSVPSTAAMTKRRLRAPTLSSSVSSGRVKIVLIAWNNPGLGCSGGAAGGSAVVLAISFVVDRIARSVQSFSEFGRQCGSRTEGLMAGLGRCSVI